MVWAGREMEERVDVVVVVVSWLREESRRCRGCWWDGSGVGSVVVMGLVVSSLSTMS